MNVNVAGRFRISGGIQVPVGPICLSISQIEVLRALRAESLRGCSPPFGFLPSEFGSHMCHIIKSQVAFLQRHGHPVHTFRDDSFCANNSGGYDTSCSHSHESATVKNDHDRASLYISMGFSCAAIEYSDLFFAILIPAKSPGKVMPLPYSLPSAVLVLCLNAVEHLPSKVEEKASGAPIVGLSCQCLVLVRADFDS